MKLRYIIIGTYREVFYVGTLTKQHLRDLKNKVYDFIIDTLEQKRFDPQKNEWVEIEQI